METTKQAIDEKFGYDEFSAQIVTSQSMSSVGVSDDGSVDVSSQVQDGFMESATLYGKTQYHDTTADVYYDSMPEDTTGMTLELVSVKMPILHTVGKNLVDMTKFNSYNHEKGYIEIDTSYVQPSNFIEVNLKPKTTYTTSVTYENTNYSNDQMYAIRIYDGDTKIGGTVISSKNTYYTYSFTTTESTSYTVNIAPYNGDTTGIYRYKNMQIEEGTQATSYEPYKSSILSLPEDVILRGIDDVKDELNCLTGELTSKIEEICYILICFFNILNILFLSFLEIIYTSINYIQCLYLI